MRSHRNTEAIQLLTAADVHYLMARLNERLRN